MLVDAHKAEYDLIQTARVETGRSPGSGIGRLFSRARQFQPARGAAQFGRPLDLCLRGGRAPERQRHFWRGTGIGERYRLTEYLVVPEHWYDVTGTCVENPEPQDEHDRNMIVKGTNEPTFLITWRSEKEIRRTLRNRAAKYIFGGAFLAVACLGIFLAKHGAF